MNSFCFSNQSEFRPGNAMLAGMTRLRPRNSFEEFPSPNRRHSSMPSGDSLSSTLGLGPSRLRSGLVEQTRLLIPSASCVIQST